MNAKLIEELRKESNYKDISEFQIEKKPKGQYTITASTSDMDRDGEIILPTAFKGSLNAYLEKNPVILFMHDMWQPPVARAVAGRIDKTFELDIEFASTDAAQEIKTLVDEGILNTVSIGGRVIDWEYNDEGIKIIKEIELWEVSIVTIPSNRSAVIQRAKVAGLANVGYYFKDENETDESKASKTEVSDEQKMLETRKKQVSKLANIFGGLLK